MGPLVDLGVTEALESVLRLPRPAKAVNAIVVTATARAAVRDRTNRDIFTSFLLLTCSENGISAI